MRNLPVADGVPLSHRCFGHGCVEEVEHRDVVAVGNGCLVLDALYHAVQGSDGLDVVVGRRKAIDWSLKAKVIGQQCPSSRKTAGGERAVVAVDDGSRI